MIDAIGGAERIANLVFSGSHDCLAPVSRVNNARVRKSASDRYESGHRVAPAVGALFLIILGEDSRGASDLAAVVAPAIAHVQVIIALASERGQNEAIAAICDQR
jgi:hypothetical protein